MGRKPLETRFFWPMGLWLERTGEISPMPHDSIRPESWSDSKFSQYGLVRTMPSLRLGLKAILGFGDA